MGDSYSNWPALELPSTQEEREWSQSKMKDTSKTLPFKRSHLPISHTQTVSKGKISDSRQSETSLDGHIIKRAWMLTKEMIFVLDPFSRATKKYIK